MHNQVVWCDIPVTDLNRSVKFYSDVLGAKVEKQSSSGMEFAVLPHVGEGVGGCLVLAKDNEPSAKGPLVYLNCGGRLDDAIATVEPNGGKIVEPKHAIGPYGFRALVLDSEGNRIALHSK